MGRCRSGGAEGSAPVALSGERRGCCPVPDRKPSTLPPLGWCKKSLYKSAISSLYCTGKTLVFEPHLYSYSAFPCRSMVKHPVFFRSRGVYDRALFRRQPEFLVDGQDRFVGAWHQFIRPASINGKQRHVFTVYLSPAHRATGMPAHMSPYACR